MSYSKLLVLLEDFKRPGSSNILSSSEIGGNEQRATFISSFAFKILEM